MKPRDENIKEEARSAISALNMRPDNDITCSDMISDDTMAQHAMDHIRSTIIVANELQKKLHELRSIVLNDDKDGVLKMIDDIERFSLRNL